MATPALAHYFYEPFQDGRAYSLLGRAAIILFLSGIVWRLYFHPLARFPGPVLAALTDYYASYYEVFKDGQLVHQLQELHERYGSVVRIGPNKLHFKNTNAYDDIYRDNCFPKDPWFYDAKSVLELEYVIQETVDRFIASVRRNCAEGNIIDVHRGFMSISLEVITTYCFAQRFEAIDYPAYEYPFVGALLDSFSTVHLVQHFPFLHPFIFGLPERLVKIVAPGALAFPKAIRKLEDQIDTILDNPALLDKTGQETIYHHLMNPSSGQRLTRDSLRQEASTLVAAGTDTIANTTSVATFHVLSNPDIEKRLTQELRDAWPDVDAPISVERLEKLPYLTAVIQEALRLGYGLVSPLPRIVTEAKTIGEWVVPQGTVVSMSHFFMHMNPDVFPNPQTFDPDRWLKHDSDRLLNYLVPFSKGQRQCVGMNLAWVELYMIVGNLFRKVELELIDTSEEDIRWKAFLTVKFKGTIKAKINKVEGVTAEAT